LESLTFDETSVVIDQHVLDKIRVVQEINVAVKGPVVEDVAILTRPLRIQAQRVSSSPREVSDYPAIPCWRNEVLLVVLRV